MLAIHLIFSFSVFYTVWWNSKAFIIYYMLSVCILTKPFWTFSWNTHINASISAGWAKTPFPPRGGRSDHDERQRGTDHTCGGSFRQTQVAQTGKKDKKQRARKKTRTWVIDFLPMVLKCEHVVLFRFHSSLHSGVTLFSRIACWGQHAVCCSSVLSTASPVRLCLKSTPDCGTAVS